MALRVELLGGLDGVPVQEPDRLTRKVHIFTAIWLLRRKSKLSINNKLLIYKTMLKPIWAYGIKLWGTASTSNLEILERFQSKALRMITDENLENFMRLSISNTNANIDSLLVQVQGQSSH
jgi:hypothetical protein